MAVLRAAESVKQPRIPSAPHAPQPSALGAVCAASGVGLSLGVSVSMVCSADHVRRRLELEDGRKTL